MMSSRSHSWRYFDDSIISCLDASTSIKNCQSAHLGQDNVWETGSLLEELRGDGSIANDEVLEDASVRWVSHDAGLFASMI